MHDQKEKPLKFKRIAQIIGGKEWKLRELTRITQRRPKKDMLLHPRWYIASVINGMDP